MKQKTDGSTIRNSILSCIFFFTFTFFYFQDALYAGIREVGTANAHVENTIVLKGNPHAFEGVVRNRSHFPENPKSYIPIPIPEYKKPLVRMTNQENKRVSYEIITGKETIHNSKPTIEDTQNDGRIEGVMGTGLFNKSNITEGKGIDESFNLEPLNFNDLSLVSNPEDYPWCVNVKLFITFASGYWVGSGVLIDAMHVLTAGHCVHDVVNGGTWATSIVVIPAYHEGSQPYGNASAVQLWSWTGWTQNLDFNHDMGLIVLDRPVGALTGWHGYGYNDDPNFYTSNTFYNPGYPAESPYTGEKMYYWNGYFDSTDSVFGQWYGNEISIYKRAYGGQSGSGAYYDQYYVYAVLSNGNSNITNFPRITSDKFSTISDSIIGPNTPSSFDLIPLDITISPTAVHPGDTLSLMEYTVENYSSTPWSGTVYANVYLSTDDNISSSDTRIQQHSFTYSFDPKSAVRITVTDPPVIPTGIPGGNYYLGVILDISDYNTGNNDSDGQDASPITITAINQNPVLSAGGVSPISGNPSTQFMYSVHYYDLDGDSPLMGHVYINGTPHIMNLANGSASNGDYQYQTTLLPGSYNYYFYFTEGNGGSGRLPSSGNYSGPNVLNICECDLNHDGRCDMRDWLLFGQRWGATNCNTLSCACDLNQDGQCNMRDWLLFGKSWGRTDCPIQ